MIRFFKISLKALQRFKTAAILNLLGLALAFTAFLVIVLHTWNEYNYDNYHPNKEHIFKVEFLRDNNTWEDGYARVLFEHLFSGSPQIRAYGIFMDYAFGPGVPMSPGAHPGELVYYEKVDRITPGFTDVIHFDILEGNVKAIADPDQVLIPESVARKFFGKESAVGKPIVLLDALSAGGKIKVSANQELNAVLYVGGVYRNFPENSRIRNVIYSGIPPQEMMHEWYTGGYRAYVLLEDPARAGTLAETLTEKNRELLSGLVIHKIRFRPLTDLYFAEKAKGDTAPGGNKQLTDILLVVAVLILVVAVVNYVNFSVALTPARIRGINTQKVLGCSVGTIRRNIVSEAVMMTVTAYLLALLVTSVVFRHGLLNRLLGNGLSLSDHLPLVGMTFALALIVGAIAGLYPAWHMTAYPPVMLLNGSFAATGRAKMLRKALIGFQYVVSIVLIICAFVIQLQHRYVSRTDVGFDKEHILQVRLSPGTGAKSELFRQKLIQHAGIVDVAFAEDEFVRDEGKAHIAYYYQNERLTQYWIGVSHNFPAVMGIPIVAGRDFRPGDEMPVAGHAVCIVNETAAKELASVSAGKRGEKTSADYRKIAGDTFLDYRTTVRIAGVFKDINFESLYRPIEPLGLWVASPGHYRYDKPYGYSYVKVTGNPLAAIDHIRATLEELDPVYPPQIDFLDAAMDALYQKTRNQGTIVILFSLIAVLLAIMGVFGLVMFEAQSRRKEIAVRRVFGATVPEVLVLFNSGFVKIVLICFVVSVPLAWFGIHKWLESFAYRAPIRIWVFAVPLLLVLILTVLTVTFQSYRVATTNAVKSLKG